VAEVFNHLFLDTNNISLINMNVEQGNSIILHLQNLIIPIIGYVDFDNITYKAHFV
jgi:hypothetical protein